MIQRRHLLVGRWRLFALLHLAVVHPGPVAVVHATHAAVSHVGHGEQGTLPLRRDGGSHAFTRSEGGATYANALHRLGTDAVGSVPHGPNTDVVGYCHPNGELVTLHLLTDVA